MNDDSKMSFLEHLEELRKRLIVCVIAVLGGMMVCWFFRDDILTFLLTPLYEAWRQVDGLEEPHPLNFTSMLEPFIAYLKLSAVGGLFVSAPVVLYQLWRFISPGLYAKEKRLVVPFVLVSTLLFAGGSIMAYSMVFPIGFRFFLDFAAGTEMTETSAEIEIGTSSAAPPLLSQPKTTGADAGFDTAVESAPIAETPLGSTTMPPSMPIPPEKDDAPHWAVALLNRLFNDDCGSLEIDKSSDGLGARLLIDWHRPRCGPLPEQVRVRRNGDILNVKWQSVYTDDVDIERYAAEDRPPTPGTYAYVLKTPKNPSAHRLVPVLMVKDYLSFALRLILAFGLIFELPILISFLAIAGIVNYRQLIHFFRYFLVIAFVVGAILTPPDVITQILLAMPLTLLYGASILVAYFFGERPEKE